jgi:RND family efflux transporter MFP subunit
MLRTICIILTGLTLTLTSSYAVAEEQKKKAGGPPPMLVETAEVVNGQAEPMAAFVGTVFFSRTAHVAAEVDGKVRQVYLEDGQAVSRGDRLVRLEDDLLQTELDGTRASYEQNQVDLAQAQRDYDRIAVLHKQDSIATTEFESYETRVSRLEKLSLVLKARLDRLLLEQKKKTIRAPFDGRIIENLVEVGEWVTGGGAVVAVADNRNLEVQVDLPAALLNYLTQDRVVSVSIAGTDLPATFLTLIPKGDLATRTFTAKFSLERNSGLMEGMQASVMLPTAASIDGLLVPRDAVINLSGNDVIFLVAEGTAKMISVQVMGYQGMQVAVTGEGLEAGQQVVVKGNERIRDGQPVRF